MSGSSDALCGSVLFVPNKITRGALLPGRVPSTYTAASFPKQLNWIRASKGNNGALALPHGDIPFLYFPVINSVIKRPSFPLLVVMFHGNGTDIGEYTDHVQNFNAAGASVLLWELPGYGICAGERTVANVNRYADAVMEYVVQEMQWPLAKVVLFGHSIGTGPAVDSAAKLAQRNLRVGGLILQSPYTSTNTIGDDHAGSFASMMTEGWNSLDKMDQIHCPILLFHGQLDLLIQVSHAQALLDAATHAPRKVLHIDPTADHNTFQWDTMFAQTRTFLQSLQ